MTDSSRSSTRVAGAGVALDGVLVQGADSAWELVPPPPPAVGDPRAAARVRRALTQELGRARPPSSRLSRARPAGGGPAGSACAWCRDPVRPPEAVWCRACRRAHHLDCFTELEACAGLDCSGREVVLSRAGVQGGTYAGLRSAGLLLEALALLGARPPGPPTTR